MGDRNVLKLDCGDGCTTLQTCFFKNTNLAIHLQYTVHYVSSTLIKPRHTKPTLVSGNSCIISEPTLKSKWQ